MSPPQVSIRAAREGDGPACARLWIEFGRALAQRMPSRFREPDPDGLVEWFERGIEASGPTVLRALAEVEGEIVGLAHAIVRSPHDPPGPALMPGQLQARVVLEDVVVAEAMRGRGIGTALVRHVERWGREQGARGMMLNSDPDGPVRRFYERLGFEIDAALYPKSLGEEPER